VHLRPLIQSVASCDARNLDESSLNGRQTWPLDLNKSRLSQHASRKAMKEPNCEVEFKLGGDGKRFVRRSVSFGRIEGLNSVRYLTLEIITAPTTTHEEQTHLLG